MTTSAIETILIFGDGESTYISTMTYCIMFIAMLLVCRFDRILTTKFCYWNFIKSTQIWWCTKLHLITASSTVEKIFIFCDGESTYISTTSYCIMFIVTLLVCRFDRILTTKFCDWNFIKSTRIWWCTKLCLVTASLAEEVILIFGDGESTYRSTMSYCIMFIATLLVCRFDCILTTKSCYCLLFMIINQLISYVFW